MKGFGMLEIGKAAWLEKDRPVAGPYDAIMRPVAISPCTSDVHTYHGGAGPKTNMIFGHEAVGQVVEVGELVTNFKPGDIAVVATCTPDWLAPNVQGKYASHDHGLMGSFKYVSSKDGSMAEFFHVNQADANMVHLPENVKAEDALMVVDMMSTGFHGVEMAEVGFGEKVVVIGIGPVGLMAVAGAKLRGAGQLIGIGTRPDCVRVAKDYGATHIVSYKDGDLVEQIHEITGGGADKVIIAGGNQDSFEQAVKMTVPGGTVANVNYFDLSDKLSMDAWSWGLGMADVTIRGGFCPGGALRMQRLLAMLENGRVDTSKMITHRFDGFDKLEDAFYLMDEKPADLIKPVVNIQW